MTVSPAISVVVPTRNRPGDLEVAIAALLRCDPPPFEIVVVDQSDEPVVLGASEIVRMVRDERRGVARARNVGFAASTGDIVLCTDDDCEVPPEWISWALSAFDERPGADVVFGRVVVPHRLASEEMAASFSPGGRRWIGALPGPTANWGISANMAIRRSAIEVLHGFDELLGAGGWFGAGAEADFMVRVVAAGGEVHEVDGPAVLHHGVRVGADARALVSRYAAGLGAATAKHRRLGLRPGSESLRRWSLHFAGRVVATMLRTGRPRGARWFVSMWSGVWASLRVEVDPVSGHYRRLGAEPRLVSRRRGTVELLTPAVLRRRRRTRTGIRPSARPTRRLA